MKKLLKIVLARLEGFIPDEEVPKDPGENFKSWLSKKDWKNPDTRELLIMILTQNFIKEYGDNAGEKIQEFLRTCKINIPGRNEKGRCRQARL